MKKYLINGKEVYPMNSVLPTNDTFEIRVKFNKLLEALDQSADTEDRCDACRHYCNDCDIVDERCARRPEHTCKKEWTPDDLKEGDRYWYISSSGSTTGDRWCEHIIDKFRKKANNVFQTEKQAEARLKEIMES